MDDDASPPSPVKHKVDTLQELVSRRLSSSATRLSAASRSIPSDKDFHFYNNFPEFRRPASSVAARSEAFLKSLSSAKLWGEKPAPGLPDDLDDYYDWLVNVNDDILERFSVSMDEFKKLREKQEEGGSSMLEDGQDGFQLVYGKKKRVTGGLRGGADKDSSYVASGVKVASRDQQTKGARSKVAFHMPMITRPQIQFNIIVNNSNKPFEHVWLERSEDGTRFIHPLEKLSVMDFVDRNVGEGDPVRPLPLEDTPFKLVDEVNGLKELCSKLQDANEFAVDLEHNHYRSFQGLTCLMQISTREEDFIIDTLKLRIHVGPYLREVFKDPSKRKVLHGADSDIMWLQRDFGIYVCNLFDTGQASRILQLERNSLEYLLRHFCEVRANKEYQTADWRLRPLPDDMIKYAREDTHYLLYIYDLMRKELLKNSTDEKDLLAEVYERSYEICRQLYEKELLTDTSYLYIYGLKEADFNSSQLAIVAALFQWRDNVARAEDESTGYVLPNRLLLEIARQMPVSSNKLRRLMRSKNPIIERHFDSLISIIRSAIQNSAAFEDVSEQLKKARLEYLEAQKLEANGDNSVPTEAEDRMDVTTAQADVNSASDTSLMQCDVEHAVASTDVKDNQVDSFHSIPLPTTECIIRQSEIAKAADREKLDGHKTEAKPTAAQISRKSSSALSSMFRATSSKRKVMIDNVATAEQGKNVNKVDQIEASFVPPLHSFSGLEKNTRQLHPEMENNTRQALPENMQQLDSQPSIANSLDEVIPLENETEKCQMAEDNLKHRAWFPRLPENSNSTDSKPETRIEEAPMSLSELSSSFQQCFKSLNEMKGAKRNQRSAQQPVDLNPQFRPFDYADARQHIRFGEGGRAGDDARGSQDSVRSRKGAARGGTTTARETERASEFQQPRRRQAFPPSGNRNATFR
ncbi:Ribonuclease D protein [Dioscorea alata]|uniref:Ribonuclease D protein n=1 Tax=Dioscorea alata TaxID=55571 RepID=A0ACB7UZL2_DIOAL|nr:Ribonuclease D protein [Dioscorea alata]